MTIARIRRRRFIRAIEVAVAGFAVSLRTLERNLVGRSANALEPSLR